MSDGSLHKDSKTMILHFQSFGYEGNIIASEEFNPKFGFKTTVIYHKNIN